MQREIDALQDLEKEKEREIDALQEREKEREKESKSLHGEVNTLQGVMEDWNIALLILLSIIFFGFIAMVIYLIRNRKRVSKHDLDF